MRHGLLLVSFQTLALFFGVGFLAGALAATFLAYVRSLRHKDPQEPRAGGR